MHRAVRFQKLHLIRSSIYFLCSLLYVTYFLHASYALIHVYTMYITSVYLDRRECRFRTQPYFKFNYLWKIDFKNCMPNTSGVILQLIACFPANVILLHLLILTNAALLEIGGCHGMFFAVLNACPAILLYWVMGSLSHLFICLANGKAGSPWFTNGLQNYATGHLIAIIFVLFMM